MVDRTPPPILRQIRTQKTDALASVVDTLRRLLAEAEAGELVSFAGCFTYGEHTAKGAEVLYGGELRYFDLLAMLDLTHHDLMHKTRAD